MQKKALIHQYIEVQHKADIILVEKKLPKYFLSASLSLLLILFMAGCAGPGGSRPESVKKIQPGDVADVQFICRLRSGEVVAATGHVADDKQKSTAFLLRRSDGPISITADSSLPKPPEGKEWSFEEEIVNRLAGVIIGMKEGEEKTVNLTAETPSERLKEDYVIRVARVRERAKEVKMTIGEYKGRAGQSPEVGQAFPFDPAVSGRVEAINQDEVIVRFSAQPGNVVPTPFGPGHIRETDKAYEIDIDARKDALVRTGPLVGRITGVDDRYITIDYRNPFGGAVLTCDVNVGKITEAKQISDSKGTSQGGDRVGDK